MNFDTLQSFPSVVYTTQYVDGTESPHLRWPHTIGKPYRRCSFQLLFRNLHNVLSRNPDDANTSSFTRKSLLRRRFARLQRQCLNVISTVFRLIQPIAVSHDLFANSSSSISSNFSSRSLCAFLAIIFNSFNDRMPETSIVEIRDS